MMPASPVIPGNDDFETVYAKDQPEYVPLPVMRTEKAVMSRWVLTPEERQHIAQGGDLFICQMNFGHALQPILPIAAGPQDAVRVLVEVNEGG
jgi:hypothetical protein